MRPLEGFVHQTAIAGKPAPTGIGITAQLLSRAPVLSYKTKQSKARSKDRSLRQLLQLDRVNSMETGSPAGRRRDQARPQQKSKAAQLPAAKPPHSTMSASSSAFDPAFDPPATSEG